jgi:hypothetical protein
LLFIVRHEELISKFLTCYVPGGKPQGPGPKLPIVGAGRLHGYRDQAKKQFFSRIRRLYNFVPLILQPAYSTIAN